MRQIVYGEQWIHPEEPELVADIFFRLGEKRTFKKGEELVHGDPFGEITLLLKGLFLYRFWDLHEREHVLSVILPKRTVGDIDGVYRNVANVSAYVQRDSVGLVLPYSVWHREITSNVEILEQFMTNLVLKQESHVETLLAVCTLDVDMRLRAFMHALIRSYYQPRLEDWNPVPLRLSTVLLAKIASASRPSISLTLKSWTEKGLLRKDKQFLVVHGELFQGLFDWWADGSLSVQRQRPPISTYKSNTPIRYIQN